MAGYSGKPLFQKLGFKPGFLVWVRNAPDHYPQLLADAEGVEFVEGADRDAVHLFCPDRATLDRDLEGSLAALRAGGILWVSWAKKSSPLFSDVTEDTMREVILPMGWVDVKVCAVDADWSGLKFLKRKSNA